MRVNRIEIFPQDRRRVSGGGSFFFLARLTKSDERGAPAEGDREHVYFPEFKLLMPFLSS